MHVLVVSQTITAYFYFSVANDVLKLKCLHSWKVYINVRRAKHSLYQKADDVYSFNLTRYLLAFYTASQTLSLILPNLFSLL